MTKIIPTVGGSVLVYLNERTIRTKALDAGAEPCPALVTHVHSDRVINVAAFDRSGKPFALVALPLVQSEEEPPEGACFAGWMPFQVGQAKKTEAGFDELLGPILARLEALERWTGKGHPDPQAKALQVFDSMSGVVCVSPGLPATETKTYSDGTTATGPAPLPDQSPAQDAEPKAETPKRKK